jgi:Xaa-Pro aminopeptidase
MNAAARMLGEICREAADFIRPGRKQYEAIADIDRLARIKGAEDIRVLAGEQRLEPPGTNSARAIGAHWALYLALQHERYWTEAGRTYIMDGGAPAGRTYLEAGDVVERMARAVKPGSPISVIVDTARASLGEERYAAAARYGFGQGIGLSQWESPFLTSEEAREAGAPPAESAVFTIGETLALRIAFEAGRKFVIYGNSYEVTSTGSRCLG